MAAEGQSQIVASSSKAPKEGKNGPLQDGEVFEQRRVRHITSILLRNLNVPSTSSSVPFASTLNRPRPNRSVSTASTSSVSTIRRAPSVKSQAGKSRERASSIASSYRGRDDTAFLGSDLIALRREVESRLCQTFVTLSRVDDGEEVYRTSSSGRAGVNFEWGRTPGSIVDVDGLPLHTLSGEIGAEEILRVAIWYKRITSNDKGKAREEEVPFYVDLGREAQLGWSILWQRDVQLRKLSKLAEDPSTSSLIFQSNALLFGLSFPLGQIQSVEKEEEEAIDRTKVIGLRDRNKKKDSHKGDETQYYIAIDFQAGKSEESSALVVEDDIADRAAIQAKLKAGEMVRGYQIEDILRLLQMQRELCHHSMEVSALTARSDKILTSGKGPIKRDLLHAEEEERLTVLRQERDSVQETTKGKRRTVQERTEAINRRKARLEMARRVMTKERSSYNDLRAKLSQLGRQCQLIQGKVYARRVLLLRQLEFIYPVDLVDGASLLFSIVGVSLANRIVEDDREKAEGENDDVVSSALGLIGQVVGLMSVYLDTPIHYPIATAGSRSIIQDSISVMSGPRIFPLYLKGVESYRFEYAIFLLNKDIEQLMNNFGITVLDIRNTLPNLKNLLVTLSASSQPDSHLSRKNMIGSAMISLKADKRLSSVTQNLLEGQSSTTSLEEHRQGPSKDEKVHHSNPGWGMSLLGWGHSAKASNGSNTAAKLPASSTTSPLPTVRSLGSTK